MKKLLILSFLTTFAWISYAGDFTADTTRACVPALITFTETGGGVGWEWDFGDGSTKVYTNPAPHPYTSPGVYTITCKVTYSDGSSEVVTKTGYVTVSAGPKVSLTANKKVICPGDPINFTATVTPGGNAVSSYSWDFGDGTTSNTMNPTHVYTTSGTRSVSLRATDTIGCSNRADSIQYILINPEPTANFTVSDSAFCVKTAGETRQATFTNLSDASATSFYWSFGDGTNSTQKDPPTKTYGVGFYDIELIATNTYGCKDTMTKSSYIAVAIFEATFSASDTVVCGLGKTVTFTGTGYGANFYKWDFGNGKEGIGTNGVTTKYDSPGKYTVTTIATSRLGCSDTMVKQQAIWVFDEIDPIVEIHDTDHCDPNAAIIFLNKTTTDPADDLGLSDASWDFGDGSANAKGDSVAHVYGSYGSWEARGWITTGYGCICEVYVQQIDIYKMDAIAYQIVPNVMMGEYPGGCLPHFVAMMADSIISSSDVIDFLWDWGETEVWGSVCDPDTTHTGEVPIGSYTYEYDTGVYTVNLILTNAQGCRDTVEAFAIIPVGYEPINDWFFESNMLCNSELSITVTAYDSLDSDSNLVARAKANLWEWYDPDGNPQDFQNPGNISPIDTGWLHGYCLLPYHNHCPGPMVCKDSVMYSCPPMAGIAYPAPDMEGNPPTYCKWPVFGFDGGDGEDTKGWDSCVWRLGNFYYDDMGVYHPQTEIHPNAEFPTGQIAPKELYCYDTLGGMKMVVERGGHIFVTLWAMNDNRNGNNLCGYCEDSASQEIIVSIAEMKLRATDQYGNIVTEVCEDQAVYLYDSTYATDGVYWWGLSMERSYDGGVESFSTSDLMGHMESDFTTPNATKFIFDTTNYTGSHPFVFEFNDWGVYTIFLKDTSATGCGMNRPMAPPYIEWQTAHWGPYVPYEDRCDTIQLFVNPRSIPYFTSNSPVCLGDTLEFTDESYTADPFGYYEIVRYLWNTGGSTDTAKNAKYVFRNAGRYDVTLTVTNEKGCDSTEKFPFAITVMGVKTSFTTPNIPVNDRKVCNKELVTFSNTSSYYDLVRNVMTPVTASTPGLTFHWDFDGQGTSNSRNAQFAFNVDSSRYVRITLTITDDKGCSNEFIDSIWVIRPVAEYTSGTHEAACPELGVQFQDLSYGMDTSKTKYEWIFGDTLSLGNNFSALKNPFHTYEYAGKYDVTLIVTDEYNCTDTMLKPQYVQVGGPYGTFTADTISGCVPLRVTFEFDVDEVNTDTLIIYYGDGQFDMTTFIGAPIKHIYTQPGVYVPFMQLIKWVYNSATGEYEKCARGFSLQDSIWVIQLTPDFETEPLYCKGVPITFINKTDSNHNNILPKDAPIDSIFWDYGNGLYDSTLVDGQTQYDTAGFYDVELTVTSKTCIVPKEKTIEVMEFPEVTVTPDSVGACVGMDVVLTADSLNGEETDFVWDFYTVGDTLVGNPVTRYFDDPGTNTYPYEIHITFSPKNCYKTYYDTLIMSAWTPPTAEFKIEDADGMLLTDGIEGINAGNDAYFSDLSTPGHGILQKWLWMFGDDDIDSSGPNVVHAYTTRSGYITVTMGVTDEYGCSDTTTHQILVLESLKFPNIFSPNNDGINDRFEPWDRQKSGYFLSFEMEIYNKWGALVWKRKCEAPNCPNYEDENFWWDGKNKQGNDVPDGVYYWVVYAKPESEKGDIILNGSVTIVR